MSLPLKSTPRAPFASKIVLDGQVYNVRVDPVTRKRFIGDYEVSAFIEKLSLQRKTEALEDLATIGFAELAGKQVCDSPQQTAWALHRQRRRSN